MAMPHPERADLLQGRNADEFRLQLCMGQPEVVLWFEQHLHGPALEIAIELAARYFEYTERWGERVPILKKSRLNIELHHQVPAISPKDRWLTELPLPTDAPNRFAIARLLTAIMTTTQASL